METIVWHPKPWGPWFAPSDFSNKCLLISHLTYLCLWCHWLPNKFWLLLQCEKGLLAIWKVTKMNIAIGDVWQLPALVLQCLLHNWLVWHKLYPLSFPTRKSHKKKKWKQIVTFPNFRHLYNEPKIMGQSTGSRLATALESSSLTLSNIPRWSGLMAKCLSG